MHNVVLSPIDPEKLISSISERVTANILKALRNEQEPNSQPEQLLSIEQAAKFLNLSKQTVYGLVSNRQIPHSKKGKRLYFSKQELTEWVHEGRKKNDF